MLLHGRLVSRQTGEMAGPCPFLGRGCDRFHWWPAKGTWYCRWDCAGCPGKPAAHGGRTGWLKDHDLSATEVVLPKPVAPPTMADVFKAQAALTKEALAYLASRGISKETARRFHLGQQGKRITVPCIVTISKGPVCLGIKKRWIGQPPESWVSRWVAAPGSKNLSIFNFDRLVRYRRKYVLIVEGLLDVVLLDGMQIPACASFGGGSWDDSWHRFFHRSGLPVHVADWDNKDKQNRRAGTRIAVRRAKSLGGIIVFPPGDAKDLGEAYQRGHDIHNWIRRLTNG